MTDTDLREMAADLIVELFQETGRRINAHGLADACPIYDDLEADEQRRLEQLIDSALVEVTVDWFGGTPV